MKRPFLFACAALGALCLSGPAQAVPGGRLQTLIQGPWSCELPGDATVMPTPRPEENFRITPDSSYMVGAAGEGNYLLLGDELTMTSGPFNGRRYKVVGDAKAYRLGDDGKPSAVRCVRNGTPTGDFPDSMPRSSN